MDRVSFARAVLARLGIQPTPENERAVVAWEGAEGGHWNNSARYNPLNTTQPAPGAGNTGTQGNIKVYTSWQQGVDATARTLRNGRYGGVLAALQQGSSAEKVAQAVGASPWGTSAGLIQRVLAGTPAPSNVPAPRSPGNRAEAATVTTPGIDNSMARRALISAFVQQGGAANPQAVQQLAMGLPGARDTPATSRTVTTRQAATPASRGPGLQLPASFQPTHQTAGLPGYPARDIFAKPGEPVRAPVSGTIVKLSGQPPSRGAYEGQGGPFGWSVYVKGANGTYFLTHLGSRNVRVGQKVQRGQVIGTVGDYPGGTPDHVHEGLHRR